MENDYIYRLVRDTVRRHKTSDPFSLAGGLGIDVDCADLGELKGFYIVYRERRYIVLSEVLEEHMSRLVLAHEIGHDLLHRDIAANGGLKETGFFDMTAKHEKQANFFAANLLISDEDMLSLGEEGYTIDEIAAQLGVHSYTAMIKARDMQLRGIGVNVPYIPPAGFLRTL